MTQRKPYYYPKACSQKLLPFFFLIYFASAFTTAAIAQPPVYTEKAKLLTRFNFKMLTGGIIILKGTVGDRPDSLNFVLDTGSGGISLDSGAVEFLRLPAVESDRTIRGIAGIRKVKFVKNLVLHIPGLKTENLDFHINNYDILTSVYGMRIDGIIGYSFLSRYIVKVNYDNYSIEVWEPGLLKYPRKGFVLKPVINSIPIFDAKIRDGNRVHARFYFDTGAGLCLLMSEDFAKDSSVIAVGKKITPTQAEGLGGKKPMYITTVRELRFGPYKFKKVPAHIFKDEYNVTAYPILGGLIGNDIFRRFNTVLNYGLREIHLAPNTHFNEAFDYSYSGMGIYFVDGDIVIEDVLEGSPAEKAGLKPGDRILAIDNNFSNNIQSYKTLLQTPGARLKMIVIRDSEAIQIVLRIKSIL